MVRLYSNKVFLSGIPSKNGPFLEGATILHGKIAGILLYSAKSLALLSSLFPIKVTQIVYFPHFKYLGKARGSYRN